MFDKLKKINEKPAAFEVYTADALWADDYRSKQMLAFHLNEGIDVSSRNMEFINRSATWIGEHFDLGEGKSLCDFGCGPGLYTTRLAKTGAKVTGLDFSANSLAYAREQAQLAQLPINYVQTNYLEFQSQEQFDLITMIMCDFCALSPAQRKVLLAKFRECLKDDGAILLDVYSMAGYAAREETAFYEKNQLNRFWCEDDYYCFVNTWKYDDEAVVLDKYSIFQANGKEETVYNWLQYFSPEKLKEELAAAGFAVKLILKDVAGSPYCDQHAEFAVVAVRA
ncbi:class I SAM-dependent methyltransferase [Rhodobacteraceae bacterium RKSG542]|uniref:SAM-dependent methyltransferase n=1 Tax=Pseudovibrio flavus TaxID=2529854 RepID=UPI0012BCFC79|nr:class I SAM-dependent methyltransferase [Pseudovibrio flavus]MTI15643.1 class I SAM-dependent methyltransferase [Pseudovibrio flavus]